MFERAEAPLGVEMLVPISIHVREEGVEIRDAFLWNLRGEGDRCPQPVEDADGFGSRTSSLAPHLCSSDGSRAPSSRRIDLACGKINHRTAPLLPRDAGRAFHLRNGSQPDRLLVGSSSTWGTSYPSFQPLFDPSAFTFCAFPRSPAHSNTRSI